MGLETLRVRLHALAFVDEFGPLYALFTLWFIDNGVTTAQLSVVFVMWAGLAIALEIPSGALADRIDRRVLLAAAFGIRAVGIAAWLVWPTFGGLLAGALLWAIHDALASGAWEAMIHDQLDAIGQAEAYGRVMARVGQWSHLGLAGGAALAAGLARIGTSIEVIGWINVAIHGGSILLVLVLPDVRWVADTDAAAGSDAGERGPVAEWWRTLRAGVSTARRRRDVARLVVMGALIEGLFIVDEYVPVMARLRGASNTVVAIVVLAVWAGLLIGGEVAARRPDLRGPQLGTLLAVGSFGMLVAVVTQPVWTLLLVGAGYGALEATWVVSDARFQAAIPSRTRATVTSVRSFNGGLIAAAAFGTIGWLATGDDPSPGLVIGVAALIGTGVLVTRWLPAPRADTISA
ncbi:MAG: MFS transporter [Ilumatobacter sp.]|nr:MFS transporter [Ilumatobacter sp.]